MTNKKSHKLIFEGVELAGKSFIIQKVYDHIEKKYNTHGRILDGCHWINSDISVFGTKFGKDVIDLYIKMAEVLEKRNVIFEKLHISDQVCNIMHGYLVSDYKEIENQLLSLGGKIILCTTKPSEDLFKKRLRERILSYPNYERAAMKPSDYIKWQDKYSEIIQKTKLPVFEVDLTELPNPKAVKEILDWIGE